MARQRWSAEQIRWLAEQYQTTRLRDLPALFRARFGLEPTADAIYHALRRNGIKSGRHTGAWRGSQFLERRIFTPAQQAWIAEQYQQLSLDALAEAWPLAWPDTPRSQGQIRAYIHNHGITSGRTGRIAPGTRPWNKGLKGFDAGGRSAETRFTPGHQRAVRFAVGHERLNKDGYIEIKVSERNPYTGGPARYRLKHRVVWEAAHGQVPRGQVVAFADGDKANCALDNLVLIRRADLARLNQDGHGALTGDLRLAAIALAEVKTALFRRARESGRCS